MSDNPNVKREWYIDADGITRSRSTRWDKLWETFWGIYLIVNLIVVLAMVGTYIWAAFDFRERLAYALIMQVPALLMMVVRRLFK